MKVGKVSSFTIVASVVFAWAGACSTSTTDGDSESHFLSTCPPGCPSGLECICGACTRACVTDAVCGSLAANATCVTHDACGAPRSCDVKCSAASDCGSLGSVCDNGVCRKSASHKVGGTGGGGGDSATPMHDGQVTPRHDARVLPQPQVDGQPVNRCGEPIDIRQCENGELFVHDPQTNTCRSAGDFMCPNNDNGFGSMAECLAACPGVPPAPPHTPGLLDWDGGPFSVPDGNFTSCQFPGSITWRANGTASTDTHELSYLGYARTTPTKRSCTGELPYCGGPGITPFDIGLAARDPDVRAAFVPPVSFGKADTGIRLTIDGIEIVVGEPCAGSPGCNDPTPGVARLVALLRQIELQQRGRGDCRPNLDCYLPRDSGPCDGVIPRFAYEPTTGTCNQFAYGGCGGNGNRFDTQSACEQACDFDPCLSAPAIVPDSGGCQGTQVGQLCAPDPMTACGCACSLVGNDASRCKLYEWSPGRGYANCP